MNKRSRLGVTLIGVRLVLLLGQLNWVGDQIFLYLLSLALFAAYKFTGGTERYSSIGFLIPSLILLAIGVFANLERLLRGNLSGGWFSSSWPLPSGSCISFTPVMPEKRVLPDVGPYFQPPLWPRSECLLP